MQIILAGPYPAGTAEKFGQLLPGNEIVTVTDQAEYEAMTEGDVIVVRVLKTPASVLAPKKDLKAVIRWGAGYDSVDIEAAGKQHDKRMNDCLPPILFSAIFKLLKVLPDTELDAC